MGVGIYLVWPAFYTDVTDAYRLGKGGRLRTDLGGVYFNALFMLGALGVYLLTHFEILIAVILLLQFEMLHQFLPFLRLDGYYMIADLTGVPDIFARMKPVLLSLLPWRKADPRVTALKGWVRVAVTLWVFLTVTFILYAYGMMLLHLPTVVGTAWLSFHGLLAHSITAFAQGHIGMGAFGTLQVLLLALPVLGLTWMIIRLVRSLVVRTWVRTRGRPIRRIATYGAMAVALLLLIRAWTPPTANYQPIPANATGTIQQSFTGGLSVAGGIVDPVAKALNVKLPVPSASPSASPAASPAASATSSSASGNGTTTTTTSPSASPSPTPSPT
jgi:putative peptide zinc metalloprotease protein